MDRNAAVSNRYAEALFLAALHKNAVEQVGAELQGLLHTDAGTGERFRRFLEAPHLSTEDKYALIEKVLQPRLHPLLVQFMRLLLAKRRLFRLVDIAREFERLVEEHRGIVRARSTSAVPLTEAEKDEIVSVLEGRTRKKIHLVSSVDPDILGGVVIRVGDRIVDTSVRSQLERLRDQLLAARA